MKTRLLSFCCAGAPAAALVVALQFQVSKGLLEASGIQEAVTKGPEAFFVDTAGTQQHVGIVAEAEAMSELVCESARQQIGTGAER